MQLFHYYILIINILGFILFGVNTFLYSTTSDKEIDNVLTIVSILGGSLGILISIFLLDRKAVKGNMMSRVFVFCILVIQIVIYQSIKGFDWNTFVQNINMFFGKYQLVLYYLLLANLITFIIYGIDKFNAINHKSRIRIVTLLMLAFFGGSVGAIIAMYLFRHKTSKDYFTVGVPLIIFMQIILSIYLISL